MKDELHKQHLALYERFCDECSQRMMCVLDVLRQSGEGRYTAACFDQVHQEFDSLVGASRAINLQEFEHFSRAMASFARYLRQKLPQQASPEEELFLREAVVLGLQCGGSPDQCLALSPERIQVLLDTVTALVGDWKESNADKV